MIIRRLEQTDDRVAISRIYEESWRYAYRGIIPQTYLDSIPSGKWASHLDRPGQHSLVALEDDRLIGTTSYCKSRFNDCPNDGEIVSIYFLPAFIGKGYGKPLLGRAVAELAGMGFRDVFLWVLEENARARRFYEKAGFHASGRYLDDTIGGKPLRELQYCLHLADEPM